MEHDLLDEAGLARKADHFEKVDFKVKSLAQLVEVLQRLDALAVPSPPLKAAAA